MSPGNVARLDQAYAEAKEGLVCAVQEARELLERHGPAKCAAMSALVHITLASADPVKIAGMLGLALTELAKRKDWP